MTLSGDIASVRDQALADLYRIHDYYFHTRQAWRTLTLNVRVNSLKFVWHNELTDSSVNEVQMLSQLQRYVADEITASTLQQFVSRFESFLFDVLRLWLLAFPERVSKRQLTGREILDLPDKPSIVEALIEKELRDVFYDRPSKWFSFLKELVKIDAPEASEVEQFAEVKATRDVLVHGLGVANKFYLDKAGPAARVSLGHPLEVPEPYHQKSWELMCKLIGDIGTKMSEKA